MNTTLVFAACALVAIQIICLVIGFYVMNQQVALKDGSALEITQSRIDSAAAKTQADLALSTAQNLQVKHFDSLRSEIQGLHVKTDSTQRESNNTKEILTNFMQKWTMRLGREAKAEKAAQEETTDALAQEGRSLPGQAANNGHLSTFGKSAR